MADPTGDNLFREIEEDLRRDRLERLWKRFGGWIIAAGVAVVLAVGGAELWRNHERSQREAAGDQFFQAIQIAPQNPDAAGEALRALAATAPAGYRLLAGLHEGSLALQRGDRAAAARIYEDLAQRAGGEPILRDAAIILAGYAAIGPSMSGDEAAALRARLSPLLADTNPWRYSAGELTGLLDLQAGNRAEARRRFAALAADPQTPAAMKARATDILTQLDGK